MYENGRLPTSSLKAHYAEVEEFNALREKEKTLMVEVEALKKAAKEGTEEKEKVAKAEAEAREKKMQEEIEES